MCGIAGHAGLDLAPDVLERMCEVIRHRGPDDQGCFRSADVSLGMRRLSIIDVAGGHQPMQNEDGRVRIVFNGEVYNFRELRGPLERGAHRFATASDTEVLVHLYEERGPRLVEELRGMFAFAIWDHARGRLLLARDRLGIKPLYYRPLDGGIAFASELKSLLVPGFARPPLDRAALASFLALGYVPDPLCIFAGVRKLPPGHIATWSRERGLDVERYWTPPAEADPSLDEETAAREIRRLLEEAVRYRMIADVPLGAFLSGGIDSSAVVAEMRRQSSAPVRTFSIGFAEPEFNEAPAAAAVAAALGTDHTELIVRPDVEHLFDDVALAFDEPFADSSAVPTLLVSRLAARHVKVALSGDGGDELFGGYTRYQDFARRAVPLPAPVRHAIGGLARRLPHGAFGRNRLLELSRTPLGRYAGMVADPLAVADGGVAHAAVARAAGLWETLLDAPWEEASGRDPLGRLMHVDLLSYLPGDILTKVDRMSMAASLEARVPLLDHVLVEFACRIPTRLKLKDGTGKWIFRRAIRDLVPSLVFERPKHGFGIPLRPWLRHELRHRVDALRAPSPLGEFVMAPAVNRVVNEHVAGRRDHTPLLWKLIVLQRWLEAAGKSVTPARG